MFSRNKDKLVAPVPYAQTSLDNSTDASLPLTAPPMSPLEGVQGEGVVLVGRGTRLSGNIKDATIIEVQGDYEGNVSAKAVIVRDGATFKGSIHAEFVEANGTVEGVLVAEQLLHIRATGIVAAEVRYGQLCVERGGNLSGDVRSQIIDGHAEVKNDEDFTSIGAVPETLNGFAKPN